MLLAVSEGSLVAIAVAFVTLIGTLVTAFLSYRAATNAKQVKNEVATGNGKTLGVTAYDLQSQFDDGMKRMERAISRRLSKHEKRDDELLHPLYEALEIEWPEDE